VTFRASHISFIKSFFSIVLSLKMGKDSLLYFLFECCDTKNLRIGTVESITFPKNFQAKLQKDKLKFVERVRNEKTEIGVRYDF